MGLLDIRKEWGFDGRTLDIGVGEKRARGAIGVDIRRTDNTVVQADGTELPFRDNAMDRVVCYHVIEHLEIGDVRRLLSEINRVLAADGRAHLLVDRDVSEAALFEKDPTHVRRYGPRLMKGLVERHLDIERYQTHNLLGNVHKHPLTFWRYLGQQTKIYIQGRPRPEGTA